MPLLLDIVFWIGFWILFKPVEAAIRAVVGILWPAKSPGMVAAQWSAACLLISGLISIAAAFALWWFGVSFYTTLVCFIAGWVLVVIAGLIGQYIEKCGRTGEAPGQERLKKTDRP